MGGRDIESEQHGEKAVRARKGGTVFHVKDRIESGLEDGPGEGSVSI